METTGRRLNELETDGSFPYEHMLTTTLDLVPWYADLTNYIVSDIIPADKNFNQRKKFQYDVNNYF